MTNVVSIFGDIDPREVPLYTVRQAAHYLGDPASTVRAWTVGQDYPKAHGRRGRFKPLIKLRPGRPARLTFNNLIEAYVLRTLRRAHQVELSTVRQAIANVTRQLGDPRPLLSRDFATDGVRIYLRELDGLLEVSTGAGTQYAIREVIEVGLNRIERSPRGLAERLYPYRNSVDEPRVVAIDPRTSFGKPTIQGSGVAVDVVADLVSAGESPARVAREFGISKEEVDSAVTWHRRAAA
jgi:uncharacterized protein (DUF433 family)